MSQTNRNIQFIDLFAGIGGIRIALENLGAKCVFSSEINEHCQITYEENFGEKPFGDITKILPNTIPDHTILTGGFPCQPFSISGKQKGFEDTRGTLFFNIMQIISEKKPEIVFLENVKHLIHHDKKRTIQTIIRTLEEEGYFVSWQVLNAKDFNLAQNRERLIIIGTKDRKFNFSSIQRSPKEVLIKDIMDKDEGDFEFLEPNEYTILDRGLWKKQKSGLIFCGYRNKKIRQNGVRENTTHLSRVHKQPNRIYHIDGTHPTIPSQETSGRFWIYDDKRVRKLTIGECYRLMGFPENYKKISPRGELYKQIGNSVPINMIQAVGDALMSHMKASYDTSEIDSDNIKSIPVQLNLLQNNND